MTLLYMKAVNTHCKLHLAEESVSNTYVFSLAYHLFF